MKKNSSCMPQRILLFITGLFINALSVALITRAALGTSPISAIPYTMNYGFPLTIGQFETLLNFCLIAGQILLLRRDFKPVQLLQIVIALSFGFFIDFWMWILSWLNPSTYPGQFVTLLIGVIIAGIGVGTIVSANVTMLCGEAFVTAICKVFHTDFDKTKIGFDCTLTAFACILSLILYHKIVGVREGTLIAAIVVGWIAGKVIDFSKRLFPWGESI